MPLFMTRCGSKGMRNKLKQKSCYRCGGDITYNYCVSVGKKSLCEKCYFNYHRWIELKSDLVLDFFKKDSEVKE